MGKRVKGKVERPPTIDVRKLKTPEERGYKALGLALPGIFYVLIIGATLFVFEKTQKIGLNLLYWIILAGVVTLILGGAHKSKIKKNFPRSKIGGSAHQEVRIQINQLCRLLEIKRSPETYIIDSQEVAATVRGMRQPYLVISSRLLKVLSPEEFEALLATLLGQIKAGNVFWRSFIHALRDSNGLLQFVALPLWVAAKLMESYLEASHHSADKVALLLLDGDYRLLTRTLVKVVSYTSESLTDQQRADLQAFLGRDSLEASASDVEQQMIIGKMLREIPGLRDRFDVIAHAGNDPAFEAELQKMEQRREKLQPGIVR